MHIPFHNPASRAWRMLSRIGALALICCLLIAFAAPPGPRRAVAGHASGLRFVDGTGAPLAGATVRVLCYGAAGASTPFADRFIVPDSDGRPIGELPGGCAYVAALRLIEIQPSGKPGHGPAYEVYHSSSPPGARVLFAASCGVPSCDIPIRAEYPLILLRMAAALEWRPARASAAVDDLREGLRRASAYLNDLTDGQMALGWVDIRAGGANWEGADLRFLADNDYRPAAYVGGSVAARTPYTTTTGFKTVFAPAAVFLGRLWDGLGAWDAVAGRWSQPNAYRTIAHEIGHYELRLYDEYYGYLFDGSGAIIGKLPAACTGVENRDSAGDAVNASAMDYHYASSELAYKARWPAQCLTTAQGQIGGDADWDALVTHYPWLLPPAGINTGPTDPGLAGDLFGRQPGFPIYLPSLSGGGGPIAVDTFEPTITLRVEDALTTAEQRRIAPQVYLESAATALSPARILHEGTTIGARDKPGELGDIVLLGAQPGDDLWVSADSYPADSAPGRRFVGAASLSSASAQTLSLAPDTWRASLDATYALSGSLLMTMTVTLISPTALPIAPLAQFCTPSIELGCSGDPAWRKTMSPTGPTTWAATFAAAPGAELPLYGLLRVQAPGVGKLIRRVQAAGGVGPAHIEADAPLRDGQVMVDTTPAGTAGGPSRVLHMPAADYNALTAPLPFGVAGIIGAPVDLDVLVSGNTSPFMIVTLAYNQHVIDRLNIRKDQLTLLYFDHTRQSWVMLQNVVRGDADNWLAALSQFGDGVYAIGYFSPLLSEVHVKILKSNAH